MIIGKIKYLLNKLLGYPQYVYPVVDRIVYPAISGYAGGSLYASNVLLVTNLTDIASIKKLFDAEKCNLSVINIEKDLTKNNILLAQQEQIGAFEHIINLFQFNETSRLLAMDRYNDDDLIALVYRSLKAETDYLVSSSQYATLTTAILGDTTFDSKIATATIKVCIEGLGRPLGNHYLICNGVYTNGGCLVEDIVKASIYLSSKYGQILAGQMVELHDGELKN